MDVFDFMFGIIGKRPHCGFFHSQVYINCGFGTIVGMSWDYSGNVICILSSMYGCFWVHSRERSGNVLGICWE